MRSHKRTVRGIIALCVARCAHSAATKPMTQTSSTAPTFRFSKLLRDAMRGETFSPGSRLRIARPIDAESLVGRHEGRGRQASGKPAIVYLRQAGYLAPDALGKMVASGEVCAVKYAVDRPDLRDDPYLAALVAAIGPERIVSGAGEVTALPHLDAFGLAGFTAGCVCIAPRLSMHVLGLLKAGDLAAAAKAIEAIRPLEGLRERLSPIRVLHEAVRLAGVAETGPIFPLLSNLEAEHHPTIQAALKPLMAAERALGEAPALAG